MTQMLTGLGALTAALALAVGAAMGQAAQPAGAVTAAASLKDADGRPVGEVTLTQYDSGVMLKGELTGLPPGWHAIHVHETGECAADFKSAGAHFNPGHAGHGLDGPRPHAGDLPNIFAAEDGSAKFELITYWISLGQPEVAATGEAADVGAVAPAPNIFDQDGAAIVVHAGPDDYRTDPSGDSGDRIACGVIEAR